MPNDDAYKKAEKKIAAALQSGAKELDLGVHLDRADSARLTKLPETLARLADLQSLDLSGNHLTELPEWLARLPQLQVLRLARNELAAVPPWIGNLVHLRHLDLAGNLLTVLPETLARLADLQSLDLHINRFNTLPSTIRQLKQLEDINLFQNRLTELPEWFGELENLKSAGLGANPITALPASMENLKKLTHLDLGDYGGGMPIGSLPRFILKLRDLEELFAYDCQLSVIPPWIGELASLRTLGLAKNRIVEIPNEILRLERLSSLELDNNPLSPELEAAHAQGLKAIKRYLRAKAKAEVVLNEAKLILVGEGEVGKSCLLGSLRGDPWEEGRPTTHGIEIKPVNVIDPVSGRQITLNGWDFGGQRVYRPTHQLFFSAPAVYLVVWKPREGPQQGFVKEWIKLVKHREPEAKILVVATHGGPGARQPDIDRQEIWDLFGHDTVVNFFHVQSKPAMDGTDGAGIAELRDAVARVAAGLPGVGRTVPKQWDAARKALAATKEPYLPLTKVFAICRKHKIDNEEDARLLLRICRDVGDLIHFEHDPLLRDVVILKPDWLATAISYVLDDAPTRDAHGLVSFERLGQLWHDPRRPEAERYPAALHPIFLRLMERFDISYRVADAAGTAQDTFTSLIAQLVDDVRPDPVPQWDAAPAPGDEEQVQVCRIVDEDRGQSASAEGLFYQLIVRLHKYSLGRADYRDSVHWQRGLELLDDTGARALLEHVANDVRITVRSPYPQRFLSALTYEVKYLVESFWKGMHCEVTVPCLMVREGGERCRGLFNVNDLIEDLRDRREEQKCGVCKKWLRIDDLLRNAPAARPNPVQELVANAAEMMRTAGRAPAPGRAARNGDRALRPARRLQ